MARKLNRLTAVEVRANDKKGMYHDGGGLYLQVSSSGTKSWIFRFTLDGRAREMGLGPLHAIPLADARKRAAECRRMRVDGIDPIEARSEHRSWKKLEAARGMTFDACAAAYLDAHNDGWRNAKHRERWKKLEAARGMTFDACAAAYLDAHNDGWRNAKHREQWRNTLSSYAGPIFGSLPVQGVDLPLVMKALVPIWKAKPETASRLRGRIEAVLDWAKVRGYRVGENPARWRGHLDKLLPARAKIQKVVHHPALPYSEISGFMEMLRGQEGIAARALKLLILTAARTGEIIGARWDEVDLDERIWVIPEARMKAGREHRVPLSPGALAILKQMNEIRESDFVFPGGRKGSRCRTWLCSVFSSGWAGMTSRRTGSGRPSGIGRPNGQPSRVKWSRWPWRTQSRTRSRPRTAAVTCFKSVGS
jgi:integrase